MAAVSRRHCRRIIRIPNYIINTYYRLSIQVQHAPNVYNESEQAFVERNAIDASNLLRNENLSSPTTQICVSSNTSIENHTLRNLIHECSNANELLSLIREYSEITEIDAATFGKAMQRSNDLKQYQTTFILMDMLINDQNAHPSLPEFNILLNGDYSMDIKANYVDIMVNKYKIKPDIFTFCLLIKSCRARAHYDEAQKYWNVMIDKFKICPNEIAYNELILVYSKAHKKGKVIEIFNEYLSKLKQNELTFNSVLFISYLNVFCRIGDIDGMLFALDLLSTHGIKYNSIIYGCIMKGYFAGRHHSKCIETFEQFKQSGLDIHPSHIFIKCCALMEIMKDDIENIEKKKNLYDQIKHCLYCEYKEYGFALSPIEGRILLSSAIVCYHNVNPLNIIQIFEELVNERLIGFKCLDDGKLKLDLHGFDKTAAQFVVRYLIAFDLETWIKTNDYFVIITGKGKHSTGKAADRLNLREFMIEELLSSEPCINAKIDPKNTGQLLVHREDLTQCVIDYAMDRLTVPSNDWFMDDFGDRKKRRKRNVIRYCYNHNRNVKYKQRNEVSLAQLKQQTCVFSEGKEIEMYDEITDEWSAFVIKKRLTNTQFLLFDKQRRLHIPMDLNSLLQVA